jgi:HIV-1 Vpr-binding protein
MADEPPASLPAAAEPEDVETRLLERAQALISRVVEQEADPNPRLIHTLATLCEDHETRSASTT